METGRGSGNRHEIDVAELKRRITLSEVVGRAVALRRSGASWTGLCPFHDDRRPSLVVSDGVGLWYCHACQEGGDVLSFVMRRTDCRFVEAVEWLLDFSGRTNRTDRAVVAPSDARRRRATLSSAAIAIWRSAKPVNGTLSERYLAARGIDGRAPGNLRHAQSCPAFVDVETGLGRHFRPAMIAACHDVDGSIMGIQRTFLDEPGRKARMRNPRLSLGQIRGGALRLGPESAEIMLTEGIEDALSLQRMFVGATVWATLGAGNLPHVALPSTVRSVILAGDADAAGRAAVAAAGEAFEASGRSVTAIWPKADCRDFNEEWIMLGA